MLKIMLGVAFGIILAGLIAITGRMLFVGALIKNIGEAFQQNQQVTTNNQNSNNIKLIPTPKQRNEVIRERSEIALTEARNKTQRFDSIYKKPEECYNMKDQAMHIKCANTYMKARAAFEKEQRQ